MNRLYALQKTWDRGMRFIMVYYVSQHYSDINTAVMIKVAMLIWNSGLNLFYWAVAFECQLYQRNEGSGEWKSNTLYVERGIPSILGTLARRGHVYWQIF